MRAFLRLLALAAVLASALPARAADDTLFLALGNRPGIAALMTDFVMRLKADRRIGHHFKDARRDQLARQLTDQMCIVAGGNCAYDGESLARWHQALAITRPEFNRLVELLQDAMDARGTDLSVQNALLARLAPLHRGIVKR